MRIRLACGVVLGAALPVLAQATESFEGGSNAGGWSFGAPVQGPTTPGGYVGTWFYRAEGLDTTVPRIRCANNAAGFTGEYRLRSHSSVYAALQVIASDFATASLTPAAVLVSLNGTPADPSDDWGAYRLSTQTLGGPGVWKFHQFPVSAQAASLPAGWNFIQFGPNSPASPTWPALMAQVDRLEFWFGDPTLFYIFQMWTVGADIVGRSGVGCYPNCDTSTQPPYLNVNDYICFNERFAAGDSFANCDESTTPPILNVLDFVCFMNRFAAGCSAP
ncbi:MAG: hypothetical protein JNM80_01550 [Phycisphaerae bacterium]|nr:hypothetical protein [Phycisphaerae bacterium]